MKRTPETPSPPLPMAFPVLGTGPAFVTTGWIPVIHHPERVFYRWARYTRKTKPTAAEAIAYAERVIWHRERRAAEKRRRLEALSHPRYEGRAA